MTRKISFCLGAAGLIGLTASFLLWYSAANYLKLYVREGVPFHDQTVITAIVENSIHNPDVQQILRTQIMLYLRSPEGKTKLAEMMKSPEMVKAMGENLQSPELRAAVIQMMRDKTFRQALIGIVREAPEMKVLRILESAVEWNIPTDGSWDLHEKD